MPSKSRTFRRRFRNSLLLPVDERLFHLVGEEERRVLLAEFARLLCERERVLVLSLGGEELRLRPLIEPGLFLRDGCLDQAKTGVVILLALELVASRVVPGTPFLVGKRFQARRHLSVRSDDDRHREAHAL